MDVIQIVEDFYPITSGGGFTDTEVAKYADEQGHNVTVFAFKLDDSPQRESYEGIDIHRPIEPPFVDSPMNSIRNNLGRLFASFVLFSYVAKYIFSNSPDVIYSTNHTVHWISKLIGILTDTAVVTFVGYTPSLDESNKETANPLYILEQLNFRFFMGRFVHCRNPEIRDDIKQMNSNASVQVTHGVVNEDRVREADDSLCAKTGWQEIGFEIDSQNHVLLFVGRLTPLKRPQLAVDIFTELPEGYELVIVGDGPEMEATKQYASNIASKGNVHLPGRLSHTKTLQTMLLADALILTSTTEAYPTVIFEALSCSSYAIAPEIGILPSLSDDIEYLELCPAEEMSTVIQELDLHSSSQNINERNLSGYSIRNFADDVCTSFEEVSGK